MKTLLTLSALLVAGNLMAETNTLAQAYPTLTIGDTNYPAPLMSGLASHFVFYNESWTRPSIIVHKEEYKSGDAVIWVETTKTVRLNQRKEGTNTVTEIRFDK